MIDTKGAQQSTSWVDKLTQIRITLGEFCIANIDFRAVTLAGLDWRYPIDIADEAIQGQLRSGAEVVYLSSLPASDRLPRLSFRKHWVRYVLSQASRYYIDVDGTFRDYLARFGAKSRKNLTRSVRIFGETGGGTIDFREYHHGDEIAAFYEAASQVTVKTYQYKLLESGLPQTDDFRSKFFALADLGRVWGYILFHDNSPVAFAYCTAQSDVLTYQTIGYDPAFRQYSPGNVLLYHILDRLFAEQRFRVFDFGTGEAPYKSFFSTGAASCAAVYYFAYTLRNLLFLGAHSSAVFLSSAAVRILSALRLKDLVKKAFRRSRSDKNHRGMEVSETQ